MFFGGNWDHFLKNFLTNREIKRTAFILFLFSHYFPFILALRGLEYPPTSLGFHFTFTHILSF